MSVSIVTKANISFLITPAGGGRFLGLTEEIQIMQKKNTS